MTIEDRKKLGECYAAARRLFSRKAEQGELKGLFRFISEGLSAGKSPALLLRCFQRLEEKLQHRHLAGQGIEYLRGTMRRLAEEEEAARLRQRATGERHEGMEKIEDIVTRVGRFGR